MNIAKVLGKAALGFVAGKVVLPYVWEKSKEYLYAGAQVAGTALKSAAVASGALAVAGAGYAAACAAKKVTDPATLVVDKGWNDARAEALHKYLPPAIFAASLTPLAYLAVRVIV